MFKDLFSNRLLIGAFAFFLFCVGGSLLYSWHVQRSTEAELERSNRLTQGLQNQTETRPAQEVNVPTENETPGLVSTPDESTDTSFSDETEVLPNETELLDMADAFLPDDVVSEEEALTEEVPVSPHGFGPYPEIPEDYPWKVNWQKEVSAEGELLTRVLIKIWQQQSGGINGGSTATINSQLRVFPHYHNTVYVTWADHRGVDGTVKWKYIANLTSGLSPNVILPILETNEIPPGIQVLDHEVDGINPYEFLKLPK